jgi:AraC-like DNA-binding protein
MSDPLVPAPDVLSRRGVLYPTRLPTFTRIEPPERVAELVRWFWIPEWNLPAGRTSRQHVISFPASNLVVEGNSVDLVGPTTRAAHRDLIGTGWAVGALLRPAAVPSFTDDPDSLRDDSVAVDAPDLLDAVTRAMHGHADDRGGDESDTTDGHQANRRGPDERHGRAVDAFSDWLTERVPQPDEEARLANALAEAIATDPSVLHVGDVASRLGVSARSAQRLCRRYVGLPPAAMIRRRRLQEAAETLRADPGVDLADLAADLGYADHAHLTRDFRNVLGFTPSSYRGTEPG